jgi:hypothetical protein
MEKRRRKSGRERDDRRGNYNTYNILLSRKSVVGLVSIARHQYTITHTVLYKRLGPSASFPFIIRIKSKR